MRNLRIAGYGLAGGSALCFIPTMSINLDELARINLLRMMDERGLKQNALAMLIGTSPQHINAIITGARGIGSDLMARMCRELGVEPWQFYVTQKTPIIMNDVEARALDQFRKAEELAVHEDISRYASYRIAEAEKSHEQQIADLKLRAGKHAHKLSATREGGSVAGGRRKKKTA